MGIFSSVFGSPSESRSTQEIQPDQLVQLQRLFSSAGDALTNAQALGTFQGPLFAGLTPEQLQGIDRTLSFANTAGATTPGLLSTSGSNLLRSGSGFGSNAGGLFDRIASQDLLADATAAGTNLATGSNADALVDAASRDVSRNLFETQLPQLARTAAATGNRSSSRTGAAEAILRRGAGDRIADIGSGIRQGLFDQGFRGTFDAFGSQTGALLDANNQLGGAFRTGAGTVALAPGVQSAFANLFNQAGGQLQADNQGRLDERRGQFNLQLNTPFDVLSRFQSVLGSPITLGSSTSRGADSGGLARVTEGLGNLARIGAMAAGGF